MGWTRCLGGRDGNYIQNFGVKRGRKRSFGNGVHRTVLQIGKGRFLGFGLSLPAQGSCTCVGTYFSFCYLVFCVLIVACFTTLVYCYFFKLHLG
jgi:hypothetical protein